MTEHKHCDDYVDDPNCVPVGAAALQAFLVRARDKAHGALLATPYPRLFADLVSYRGEPMYARSLARVQVVMASRLGDVGITSDLSPGASYQRRVWLDELTCFSETP